MVLVWLCVALTAIGFILGIGAFALKARDNRFAGEVFFGGAAVGFVAAVLWLAASVVGLMDAAGIHAA